MAIGFPQLCNDCSDQVFFQLNHIDLANCCQVSTNWNNILMQDKFWDIGCLNTPKDFKKHINEFAVTSYKALEEKYANFAKEISEGKFFCLFPFNPDCMINIQMGCGDTADVNDPWPEKCSGWIFMKEIPDENEKFDGGDNSILQAPRSFFKINRPNHYYSHKLALPEKQGAEDFANTIKNISEQRIKEIESPAVLREKIYKYSLGFVGFSSVIGLCLYFNANYLAAGLGGFGLFYTGLFP